MGERAYISTGIGEDAANWIGIEEASKLTGLGARMLRVIAKEAAPRGKAKLCPPAGGIGRPTWFLHRSLRREFRQMPEPATASWAELREQGIPEHKIDHAKKLAWWVDLYEKRCHAQPKTPEALIGKGVAAEMRNRDGIRASYRSIRRWQKIIDAQGEQGLIDKRGLGEDVAERHRGGRSPEAIEVFYSIYHTQQKISLRQCHETTVWRARKEGWSWASSEAATRKWLDTHDDLSLTMLMREGQAKWARRFMSYIESDVEAIEPGDLFVCDHAQLDFWATDARGVQVRPWLSAIQDRRSRVVVGWSIGPAPHQDSIIEAMRRAFRDFSIPVAMKIDNGRDYTSKLITGMSKVTRDKLRKEYGADVWAKLEAKDAERLGLDDRFRGIAPELGIKLIYALPYSPWSKGACERLFGSIHGQFDKTWATYCGRDSLTKPEALQDIRRGYTSAQRRRWRRTDGKKWKDRVALQVVDQSSIPTLDQVREAFAEWLHVHHNTAHTGEGMNGRSPLQVWNTATRLRRAEENALLTLMNARGVFKVGANGVGVKIAGRTIRYGASAPCLTRLRGREVFITLDPDDVSCCHAWTAPRENRRYIGRLEANKRISPMAGVTELREAAAAQGRRRKTMHRARREAPARIRGVEDEINLRARKTTALAATGTDGEAPHSRPVQTTFEGVSKPVQRPPAALQPGDATMEEIGGLMQKFVDRTNAEEAEKEEQGGDPLIKMMAREEPVKPYAAHISLEDLDLSEDDDDDDDEGDSWYVR